MDKSILNNSIILIGPMHVGASLIAEELSDKCKLPIVDVNKLRKVFFPKFGYDVKKAEEAKARGGVKGYLDYQKQFEANLACYVLDTFLTKPSIVVFGAGFTVYKDKGLFNEVQDAMHPYKNVINLVLPPNYKAYNLPAQTEINNEFINSNCNYLLSKFDITVDIVDYDAKNKEYVFSDYKLKNIIDNIISLSGNKKVKR